MATQGGATSLLSWQGVSVNNFNGMIVDALPHQVRIESARCRFGVIFLKSFGQPGRPLKMDTPTAARPKEQFQNAFQVREIAGRRRVGFAKDFGDEMRNRSVSLLERE